MPRSVVIIGGGQAALSCAIRLREAGHDGDVTIVGDEPWLPYQRPPLSKAFLLGKMTADRLGFRPRDFFEKSRIEVRTGVRANRIDRSEHLLDLDDGNKLGYDSLVLATGSRARLLPDGIARGLKGIFTLRSIHDADRLCRALGDAKRVLVVGGGYVGLEVASISAGLGLEVTVLEMTGRILQRVACVQTAEAISNLHTSRGVSLKTEARLEKLLEDGDRVAGALLGDGTTVPADLVVVGIGGVANDELAASSGLAVSNGIVVDKFCRTADPDVFAAGDCAVFPFADRMIRLESVQNAVDQGITAANAIIGQPVEYKPVPWFWSDQYDAKLQSAGLALEYDRVISVQSGRADGVAFWYFRDGNAVAVDTINDARTHMAARRLFGAGVELTPELLVDPRFDLMHYVRVATSGVPEGSRSALERVP
jgi:3-phenylpropionate/trans-cinnamate dioxygenase ferredoxin reductase subunit